MKRPQKDPCTRAMSYLKRKFGITTVRMEKGHIRKASILGTGSFPEEGTYSIGRCAFNVKARTIYTEQGRGYAACEDILHEAAHLLLMEQGGHMSSEGETLQLETLLAREARCLPALIHFDEERIETPTPNSIQEALLLSKVI